MNSKEVNSIYSFYLTLYQWKVIQLDGTITRRDKIAKDSNSILIQWLKNNARSPYQTYKIKEKLAKEERCVRHT